MSFASAGDPGFLELAPFALDELVMDALERWGYTRRRWRLGKSPRGRSTATATALPRHWTRCLRTPSPTLARMTRLS